MDAWTSKPQNPTPAGAVELTVDSLRGDDAAAAPGGRPFRTIAAAVEASRNRRPGQPAHVVLKGGTHFLSETVELGAADSHLTIRNANGEHAVVSGGVNLTTNWKPSQRCKGCFEAGKAPSLARHPPCPAYQYHNAAFARLNTGARSFPLIFY